MPQMLLVNPRKRSAAKRKTRKAPSAAQRRARAAFAAMARARSKNPAKRRVTHKRRRNPISLRSVARRVYRRRRNPSLRGGGLFKLGTYVGPIKDAAVMGAGAVAVDVAFGYINPWLPASLRKVPGTVGVGDAVKAVLTVALGNLLSGVTRGLSRKAAMGAMVVQARDIAMTLLPPQTVSGLGFVTSGRVVNGMTGRVNSNNAMSPRLAAYTGGPGQSPLLSGVGAYTGGPGQSPLLSRVPLRRV